MSDDGTGGGSPSGGSPGGVGTETCAARGRPAVLYVRMAPQLQRAVQRAAEESGVSMNAFALHVLASAVAPQLHALSAESLDEYALIPDSVPVTTEDLRRARRLAELELRAAKWAWRDRFFGQPDFSALQRSMSDQAYLDWYRNVWVPESGRPNGYVFKRGR